MGCDSLDSWIQKWILITGYLDAVTLNGLVWISDLPSKLFGRAEPTVMDGFYATVSEVLSILTFLSFLSFLSFFPFSPSFRHFFVSLSASYLPPKLGTCPRGFAG